MNRSIVIALVLASVAPAAAEDRAGAERYFRAGAKAYAAQSFAAAVANFEEAYRALPLPEIAFSTAQAYRRLYRIEAKPQHARRAVELYRIYLDQVKTGGRVGDAADSLGELERELSRIGAARAERAELATAERTRLGVSVTIEGALAEAGPLREVGDALATPGAEGFVTKLDGKVVEPFALLDVSPGDHTISVTAAGYFPIEKQQRAVKGATALVEIELVPQPATVTVKTERGARIAIDGRGVPSARFELAAGTHWLTVAAPGREPFGRQLDVTRGQRLDLAAPLDKTGKRRAVPWVLGGAGTLGALSVTSIILAVVHDGRADDRRREIDRGNADPTVADAFDRERASRDRFKTSAWVLGGAAVAAGTVGVLLYTFDRPSAEAVRLAPVATSTGAGVSASGRF